MTSDQKITLRSVTEADQEFLLSVYASSRAEELARVAWTPQQKDVFLRAQFTAQNQHYAAQYPDAAHEIICANGTPVGRIYMDRSGEIFHILDITVLSEHRNGGIGSFVLRQVLEEAAKVGKAVTIYVENFNPSRNLFSRLGFVQVEEQGFHLLLRWNPKT
jgi:ribosomal protein S18 acetylase RimI-like enzyme